MIAIFLGLLRGVCHRGLLKESYGVLVAWLRVSLKVSCGVLLLVAALDSQNWLGGVAKGGAGGGRSRIWVGGVVLGGFWWGVKKRCWDLAGLWRGSFAVIGFTHPQPNFAKIKSDCGKKLYHFMLFGVYAVIIFIIHTCHHKSQLHPKSGIM